VTFNFFTSAPFNRFSESCFRTHLLIYFCFSSYVDSQLDPNRFDNIRVWFNNKEDDPFKHKYGKIKIKKLNQEFFLTLFINFLIFFHEFIR